VPYAIRTCAWKTGRPRRTSHRLAALGGEHLSRLRRQSFTDELAHRAGAIRLITSDLIGQRAKLRLHAAPEYPNYGSLPSKNLTPRGPAACDGSPKDGPGR